jgi:hypothetical protein
MRADGGLAQLAREAVARVGHVSVVSAAVCRGGAVEAAGVLRPVVYESGPAPPTAHDLRLHPGLAAPDADAIAFRLEVPRLVLRQAADAYAHARGRAARGRVLVGVVDQLGADACPLDRILRV